MDRIILKKGREASLLRFHPWVFSGAVASISGNPSEGDLVEVFSSGGEFLATGHYQKGSITVRVLSFEPGKIGDSFWEDSIRQALQAREAAGLFGSGSTDCFRLVHGEGDNLPGLIVDYYNGVCVMQAHSVGMFRSREEIAGALRAVLGDSLKAVYDKSSGTAPFKAGLALGDTYLYRALFCYTGGFTVYALAGGALYVDSVDSSQRAIDMVERNVALNGFYAGVNTSYCTDAIDFLHSVPQGAYDLMIVDPPAFAKHRGALDNALRAYQRLNAAAIAKAAHGALVFTFSCSQVVDKEAFALAVFSAAASTGRKVRIFDRLCQPADHAVNIYHPEGEYLKGLLLYVE